MLKEKKFTNLSLSWNTVNEYVNLFNNFLIENKSYSIVFKFFSRCQISEDTNTVRCIQACLWIPRYNKINIRIVPCCSEIQDFGKNFILKTYYLHWRALWCKTIPNSRLYSTRICLLSDGLCLRGLEPSYGWIDHSQYWPIAGGLHTYVFSHFNFGKMELNTFCRLNLDV